jgi:hypothetical protein
MNASLNTIITSRMDAISIKFNDHLDETLALIIRHQRKQKCPTERFDIQESINTKTLIKEPMDCEVDELSRTLATVSSSMLHGTMACSGYYDKNMHLPIISSSTWTSIVFEVVSCLGLTLPEHKFDRSDHDRTTKAGRWHACHAELKLMAFYLLYLITKTDAVGHLGRSCDSIMHSLDITISSKVCDFCSEFAHRLYHIYGIAVRLSYDGQNAYPRCKNHYCQSESPSKRADGSLCDQCHREIDGGNMMLVKLPKMTVDEFQDLTLKTTDELRPESSALVDVLRKVLEEPKQGFHLISDGETKKESLRVLVPHPQLDATRNRMETAIIAGVVASHLDGRPVFHGNVWEALVKFIKFLGIENLARAYETSMAEHDPRRLNSSASTISSLDAMQCRLRAPWIGSRLDGAVARTRRARAKSGGFADDSDSEGSIEGAGSASSKSDTCHEVGELAPEIAAINL